MGDFKLPGIDWVNGVANGGDEGFVQALHENLFSQLVEFPTHTKGNCLDLIVSNIPERIGNISEVGRLGKSDHCIIQFELAVSHKIVKEKIKTKNWKRADWDRINIELEATVWPTTEDQTTAEEAWKLLRDRLDDVIDRNVPTCSFRPRKSDWMNGDLLREIRKKRRLWKKVKGGGNKQEYEDAAKRVKNMIRSAKRGLEKRLAKEKDGNSKPFYNYVKKKTTARSGIGPLRRKGGELISDEVEMATELNDYFATVFSREDTNSIPDPQPMRMRSKLTRSWITTEKVRRQIRKLKPHSAAGPDGIAPPTTQKL